jgi:hypothetical protein
MSQAKIVVVMQTFLMDGLLFLLTVLFHRVVLCAAISMMNCEVARVLDVCVGIQTPIALNLSLQCQRCISMLRAAGMVHVCLLLRSNHDMRMLQLSYLARAVPLHHVGCCFQQRSRQWQILATALQ